LALSVRLSLPQASLTLARNLLDRGKVYMAGLYPTPTWQPEDGFHVDKGLLFALIRQESGFNPYAKSYVGARGLMQLMPGTAHHVRSMQGLTRLSRNELYNPAKNMKLGQDYLTYLQDEMGGNLVQMIAAYNAGPGNVHRWADNLPTDNPLLFIESIPYQETRNYVMHVMSNLWIYHRYFKGKDPILSAMAKNQWPSHVQVAQVLEHSGG
jgi:soluble lytic murein transglycosylase-like protein